MTRQSYAPEIRIIRLMCTGRADLAFVFRAFAKGADGVIIGGCWPGECHYVTEGNYDALGNNFVGKKLLERIGVEEKFAITGGIAKNPGVVSRLSKELDIEFLTTDMDTQIAGALGAALFAKALYEKKMRK